MKKIFRLFASVAMFASLFAVNVSALSVEEGDNSASADVTVGFVETPVYTVDITWDGFVFDWKYQNGEYTWTNQKTEMCGRVNNVDPNYSDVMPYFTEDEYNTKKASGEIFLDDSCTTSTDTVTYSDVMTNAVYAKYTGEKESTIMVTDTSTGGDVVVSVNWTPASGYDWVKGKFGYSVASQDCMVFDAPEMTWENIDVVYTDSSCTNYVSTEGLTYEPNKYYSLGFGVVAEETYGGEIPKSSANGMGSVDEEIMETYNLTFNLEVDDSKTITTPKAGDTIGSVTVSIAARQ